MDDLDAILDAALKEYIGQPAPLGIERRVLRRVQAAPSWRIWLPTAVVLAGVSLVLLMPPKHVAPMPLPTVRQVTETPPVAAVTLPPAPRHYKRRVEQPSTQQLALLRFVQAYPAEALGAVNHEDIQLLDVAPIKIDELKTEELSQ